MPEEIKQTVLKPRFKLSKDELAKLIEGTTGQKPKSGFVGLSVSQLVDGSGIITWVDSEGPATAQTEKPLKKETDAGKSGSR